MQDSSETVGWIVIVLLAIAAMIANLAIPRLIGEPVQGLLIIILFMTLLAICGLLAMRYKWRD